MNPLMKCAVILLSLFCCVACGDDGEKIPPQPEPLELQDAEPILLKSSYAEKVQNDNSFAFDLLKATVKYESEPNVFISPLSVSMALSMTLNGAEGETATEMFEALRFGDFTMEEVNDYNKTLREALLSVDPSTELNIANSIWNRQGIPFVEEFKTTNKQFYDAEISTLDFLDPASLGKINGWIAEKTNNRIPEALDEIPEEAISYLVDAIYFKGVWREKFEKSNTQKETFTTEDGRETQVDMMNMEKYFAYAEDDNAGYLKLPYGNNAFSMVIGLPLEGKTVDELLTAIDNDSWGDLNYRGKSVRVKLPKFKAECSYEFEKEILPYLGMRKAFIPEVAKFPRMTPLEVFVSGVIQKTFVEVNEEGTEAAAATVVEIRPTSVESDLNFYVTKPFLFFIQENSTGAILFAGKMGEIE